MRRNIHIHVVLTTEEATQAFRQAVLRAAKYHRSKNTQDDDYAAERFGFLAKYVDDEIARLHAEETAS